jgi:hypothetical protein
VLSRARWHTELDLHLIKQTTPMDVLRGKTPATVLKEIWGHLLVYSLIRATRYVGGPDPYHGRLAGGDQAQGRGGRPRGVLPGCLHQRRGCLCGVRAGE